MCFQSVEHDALGHLFRVDFIAKAAAAPADIIEALYLELLINYATDLLPRRYDPAKVDPVVAEENHLFLKYNKLVTILDLRACAFSIQDFIKAATRPASISAKELPTQVGYPFSFVYAPADRLTFKEVSWFYIRVNAAQMAAIKGASFNPEVINWHDWYGLLPTAKLGLASAPHLPKRIIGAKSHTAATRPLAASAALITTPPETISAPTAANAGAGTGLSLSLRVDTGRAAPAVTTVLTPCFGAGSCSPSLASLRHAVAASSTARQAIPFKRQNDAEILGVAAAETVDRSSWWCC